MIRRRPRTTVALCLAVALVTLAFVPATSAQFFPDREPTTADMVFGCNPGPVEELHHADPPIPAAAVHTADEPPRTATLTVHTERSGRRIEGAGFNLEHTLWSCQPFRRVLNRWILEPFQPEVARVDTGQLPLAPEHVSVDELGWDVYQATMDDPKYQPSWEMLERLNRADVKLMLGVWGMPGQFTDNGTRRGQLLPEHIDKYVEYYTAVVDYLVRRRGIVVWSATVMNEPDGGDGTLIPPDEFMEVARRLGPALAPYGVTLYGPDTASAANALPYVDRLLREPDVLAHFSAIATHEYFVDHAVEQLRATVRGAGVDLPIYVTEYTSFRFGALDRGQETTDEIGHMLDSLQVFASVMNAGADAALYWDAVDYYQGGHAAVTRWGLLRGPDDAFEPRTRYYGFAQVLPFLVRDAEVVASTLNGPELFAALAVGGGRVRPGDLAIVLINRSGPIDLALDVSGPSPTKFEVYVTDVEQDQEHVGRVKLANGAARVSVPARSVVTLAVSPAPDDDE